MIELQEQFRAFTARFLPDELPYFDALWSATQDWLVEWDGVLPEYWPSAEEQGGEWLAELGFADLAGLDAVLPALIKATEATIRGLRLVEPPGSSDPAQIEMMARWNVKRFGAPLVYRQPIAEFTSAVAKTSGTVPVTIEYEVTDYLGGPGGPRRIAFTTRSELNNCGLKAEDYDLWVNVPLKEFWFREILGERHTCKKGKMSPKQMEILACLLHRLNEMCSYETLAREVWGNYEPKLEFQLTSDRDPKKTLLRRGSRDPLNFIHQGIYKLRNLIVEQHITILQERIDRGEGGYRLAGRFSYCTIRVRER